MHSYVPIILVTWIIEGPDDRGPDCASLSRFPLRRGLRIESLAQTKIHFL